jgi:predicted  nucleic acid-binding Zn-ribbon protein
MAEVQELHERIARIERDRRDFEENYNIVMGPNGNIRRKVKTLEREYENLTKRIIALEEELANIKQAKQNKSNKQNKTEE